MANAKQPLPDMASRRPSDTGTPTGRGVPWICPELLSPAGDWDCARAAVENGADAIYFGLDKFNARMRAHNFTLADLPRLMDFLHRRGVKGFLTFNTLVFDDELPEAEALLRDVIAAGLDAAIVQDVGICRLIRRLSPDFPIHASTQMTISNAAGLAFARELGCSVVALARECSVDEIAKMQAELTQTCNREDPPPSTLHPQTPALEVFIHGALCVAYSGQCLTSEALGGRSANRGVCAQACRLPYELISDDQVVPLGDKRYLLSPQDLAGIPAMPDLIRAGVRVLKIEGRLKSPEYVANITRIYRQALNRIVAEMNHDAESPPNKDLDRLVQNLAETHRYDMEMAFSRGLYTGWLRGINNRELVHARFPKKRGVFLGEVQRVENSGVLMELKGPLKPGDGVVFDAGRPDLDEEGGRVYEIQPRGKKAFIAFGYRDVDWGRVHVGDRLWKTSDPALDKKLRQTFSTARPLHQRPIDLDVYGEAGKPLRVIVRTEHGHVLEASSAAVLVAAQNQPLGAERLREQLGRLGGTAYKLRELRNHLREEVMLPVSELNRLRRQIVDQLEAFHSQPPRWTLHAGPGLTSPAEEVSAPLTVTTPGPEAGGTVPPPMAQLIPLVRSLAQLEAALQCGSRLIYCELEDLKKYREATRLAAQSGNCSGGRAEIFVAPPRIFKPGEEWMLKQIQSSEPDGYLARNYEHLQFFAGARCVADSTLNIANHLSAEYFATHHGLERVTASFDLDGAQMESLIRAFGPERLEISIHHYMPMFHMEHCVFCAFLSSGTDYTNCGRPCEKHAVQLRDRVGARHPLKADAGCRNTVYNARAQTGAEFARRWAGSGVRWLRVEFLEETPAQVVKILGKYRALLRGDIDARQLCGDLKLINRLGVLRGPE